MTTSDLMAVMTYEGGSRPHQAGLHGRSRGRCATSSTSSSTARTRMATACRDEPDQSSAFGQGDAEFNIFNTDRQLAALQTAVTMLRPFPEQKALVYFGERPAVERQRQHRPVAGHDQRRGARQRDDQPGGRARAGGAFAARRRDAAVARRPGRVHRPDRDERDEHLPALAGHAVRARQGHRRHGDVRQQRPVGRHRAGCAGDDELLHHRLLQHAPGQRRQVPARQGDADERPGGRSSPTGRATLPTRSGRGRTASSASGSSKKR